MLSTADFEVYFSLNLRLFIIISGTIAFSMYIWVKLRRKQLSYFRELGIPYVEPNLITGSLHLIRKNNGANRIQVVANWLQEHGKVFGYYAGWKPYLVVSDLDMIKTILVKDFQNFSNRPQLAVPAQPVIDTLVGLRDQRWKDVRAIMLPTFSMAKMKTLIGILNRKVDTLLEIVEEKASTNEPIEWHSVHQGLTLDSICECAIAMKTDCQRKQNDDFLFKSVRQYLHYAFNPAIFLALCFPIFAFLLGLVSNTLSMSGKMTKAIVTNLKEVIKIRRKDIGQRNVDVLQLLIDSGENPNDGKPKDGLKAKTTLTDDEIIANAWVFLLGGFETTSACLTYTTYLLAKHPHIQEKLFKELQKVAKNLEGNVTYETVNELAYLEQVVNESLRLYPPVVAFISRETKEDTQINGICLKKGLNISLPVWHIHRNPQIWEDPDKFDPERFSHENKKDRHPMAFMPFGAGPRNCIGMRFAMMEIKLAMARIILKYRLMCCDKTPTELRLSVPTVALNPIDGIWIKAVPRSD